MNYVNYYKQMRIILLYDLPTVEEKDKKEYTKFHKKMIDLGFHMLQYSVYVKVLQNETNYKQIISRLNNIVPNKGQIILFKVTEKQYQDIYYLKGEQNKYDSIVGGNELVIFGGD